jgi:hypothetical protein
LAGHPAVVAWFAAASHYLHRRDLRCPAHRVAHTGKLARAIVLDLCLLDSTGQEQYWQRAVERARYVVSRLGPDPEHGAFIYFPGRLDPRNCSNSVIDSGECTGALATLVTHPQAAKLAPDDRLLIEHAVAQNAETYLRSAVTEKGITNQRLWGAMGLASAYRWRPDRAWLAALRESLCRSIDEQRADGSWVYEPEAPGDGAFAGAADLTVYYHGRCLAFLLHVLETAPSADPSGAGWPAVERGLEFLAGVTTPDGLKPLALEGKRWFWDGPYEVGSNAYDVFALRRGAAKFGRPEWAHLADRVWWQLARHQDGDGAITACRAPVAADFVCRDFHTADLAWTAQAMAELPDPADKRPASWSSAATTHYFPGAGVLRLEAERSAALVRTAKQPANTQFGGAVGGGGLLYAGHRLDGHADGQNLIRVDRERTEVEGSFVLYPRRPDWRRSARRFLANNPLGREGRQWIFVARLLARQGRPRAAVSRLWRGYFRPLIEALPGPVTCHWATRSEVARTTGCAQHRGSSVTVISRPATMQGVVPSWASDTVVERHYQLQAGAIDVQERLRGGRQARRITYLAPAAAHSLETDASVPVARERNGRRLVVRPQGRAVTIDVRYRL